MKTIVSQPTLASAPNAETIALLVHGFYDDVRNDPLLGPVFESALQGRWDAHLQRLIDFWGTVALGTRSFSGDVLGKHMALEDITPAHFAAWVGLWQKHTELHFAPDAARDLQRMAHRIARNIFRGYFGSDPGFAEPRKNQSSPADPPHSIAGGHCTLTVSTCSCCPV